jgi:hypothetical protein
MGRLGALPLGPDAPDHDSSSFTTQQEPAPDHKGCRGGDSSFPIDRRVGDPQNEDAGLIGR